MKGGIEWGILRAGWNPSVSPPTQRRERNKRGILKSKAKTMPYDFILYLV